MTAALPIPASALDDRLGFVGTAGSGKTYNAGGCVERLLASGARCVIVDPLDVWFGLRLRPDGETPSPFKIVILGGAHGDLPLNEHAGALIGETVAKAAESFIVSLGGLPTKAAERRFMLPFLTALYRHVAGEPLHLVFDEADLWAPQRLLDKEADAAKLLGQMEQIVRRGRIKGFVPWLITQRPAVLSKDVLSQVDGLVAFKLTSSQDRDAIGEWVKGQADLEQWRAIWAGLPTLQRGHGVVWIPGRGILETAAFPEKRTFDSSATPKRGETRAAAALKPLNVDALRGRLDAVAKEAVENDPKRLKAKIAELEREMRGLVGKTVDGTVLEAEREKAQHAGYSRGKIDGYAEGIAALGTFREGLQRIATAGRDAAGAAEDLQRAIAQWSARKPMSAPGPAVRAPQPGVGSTPQKSESRKPSLVLRDNIPRPSSATAPIGGNGAAAPLARGEKICLAAIAGHPAGVTRQQLTVLTGYKKTSRDTYLQRLRQRELIAPDGERIVMTEAGRAALGADYEPLPTGDALRAHWLGRLPEGERRVLEAVVERYPDPVERTTIDEATGYKKTSRDTYLKRLAARELVVAEGRGLVRAADELFG